MDLVFELILIVGIAFFSAWLMYLSLKLSTTLDRLSDSDEQLEEIREGIELVGTILNKLPELMPTFTTNTNPLQPIFEAFAQKLTGQQPLMTYVEPERGADGKYGTQTEDENDTASSQTNG